MNNLSKIQMTAHILSKIEFLTYHNRVNVENGDVMRSATTEGAVSAYVNTLDYMGYATNYGQYIQNDCLRIGFFMFEGKEMVVNGYCTKDFFDTIKEYKNGGDSNDQAES